MTDAIPVAAPRDETRTIAIVGYALLLAGVLTNGLTSLGAVVLAYIKRDNAPPLEASHFRHQIRTFWIGFIGSAVGMVAMFVPMIVFQIVMFSTLPPTGSPPSQELPPGFWAVFVGMGVGMLVLLGVFVWTLVRTIIGLTRLTSNQPIGQG